MAVKSETRTESSKGVPGSLERLFSRLCMEEVPCIPEEDFTHPEML